MNKDLGTYHLRIVLADGRGWIQRWDTGARYTGGTTEYHPLDSTRIGPQYESENELFFTMVSMYVDGGYSCDCNKALFLARAYQQEEPDDPTCGDEMSLAFLVAICPNGSEVLLFGAGAIGLDSVRSLHTEVGV